MHRLVKDAKFTAGLALRKPFSCLVQVTNRCNMMCSFCDFWPNVAPKQDELTVADYERVAAEMAELGTYCVSIPVSSFSLSLPSTSDTAVTTSNATAESTTRRPMRWRSLRRKSHRST